MKFLDRKTNGGAIKGKLAFYCNALHVTRQGFYWYLKHRDDPWKYEGLAEKMRAVVAEDECDDTYGRCRMCQALMLKYPEEKIPGERTVCRIADDRMDHLKETVKKLSAELQQLENSISTQSVPQVDYLKMCYDFYIQRNLYHPSDIDFSDCVKNIPFYDLKHFFQD